MTAEQRQKLRLAAKHAVAEPGPWVLQTSNSWRRIGTDRDDGSVLCPTMHPRDRHPDLSAPPGVLEYIIAAQPAVVLELLDYLDKLESDATAVIENQQTEIERMRPTQEIGEMMTVRDIIDRIVESKRTALR